MTRARYLWAISVAGLVGCSETVGAPEPLSFPEPLLVALSVTGGKELNPTFDQAILRYSVVALGDIDSLTIGPTVDSANAVYVDGVEVPDGSSYSASATPGSVIEIVVMNAVGDGRTYEVVYLPTDFPELTVTVPRGHATGAVTYLTMGNWLAIIDDHAVPSFYRREELRVLDFKIHPTGERSYAVRTGQTNEFGRSQNVIVVLDQDFNEVDRVSTIGLNHTDNHEFLIRPNGNYVLLAYHGVRRNMTTVGGAVDQLVEESVVQEVTRDGAIVFQWTSWGQISTTEALRDWADYAHVNSIFIDAEENFIISARGVSQVLKIERGTGDVMWKLGGHSNQFTFIDDPFSNLCGQHTASVLPNGNLLAFDNGQLCWPISESRGDLTRVVEYRIDPHALTATLVWSYSQEGAYTISQGSAQSLDGGNTLIGWGRGPTIMATEIDARGTKVWELEGRLNGEVVRTYRAFRAPR